MENTIETIKNEFKEIKKKEKFKEIPGFIERYTDDDRAGVKKIIENAEKAYIDYKEELERIYQMSIYEREYSSYNYICGIDEVGRGPLAGPVVACSLILPKNCEILYVNDSKKLSEKTREKLCGIIKEEAVGIGIGVVDNQRIDEINILNATYEAMRQAISNLKVKPDLLLNDAVTIPGVDIKQIPVIKGDQKSISIAAASIVAKVTRDKMMKEFDIEYPGYNFKKNVGYGTKEHIAAIRELGITPLHRKSFLKNIKTP